MPKVPTPDTIDKDAGGQWVVRGGDGVSQLFAATAFGKVLLFVVQDFEEPARGFFARSEEVAADRHFHVAPALLTEGMGKGVLFRLVRLHFFVFCMPGFDLLAEFVVEVFQNLVAGPSGRCGS